MADADPHAPPVTQSADLTGLLTMKVVKLFSLMRRRMVERQRREFDLSEIEWRILTWLTSSSEVSLNGLADLLLQDRGQLSRAVKGLVERGLLTRKRVPGGPEIAIALSAQGRALRRRMEELALEREEELTGGLDAAELAVAQRVIDLMIARVETPQDQR